MAGLHGSCVRTYGGVYDLAIEQVRAHSSGRVERVDRLHHRLTEGAEHID
jgi:hypothetical protein